MKISFPKYSSDALLNKKRGASYIISSILISFFAGFAGSYLLENNFGVLALTVLGIAGIVIGGVVSAWLNWSKIGGARSVPIEKRNVPRITSGWDYRPRKAIRRYAAVASTRAETAHVPSGDPFAINSGVWCPNDSYINA